MVPPNAGRSRRACKTHMSLLRVALCTPDAGGQVRQWAPGGLLKKPENLRKLVLYMIGQPPTKPGEAERESDVRTRHSLAACEALCSLIEELPELIAENESLLRTLFSATGELGTQH